MKIFFLVSRIPWPLEKGDKLRAWHQLREMAAQNEVHICCLSDEKPHPEAMKRLFEITPHVTFIRLNRLLIFTRLVWALGSREPFQVHYFYQRNAARQIRKLIQQFKPDWIYTQLIRTSEYVKDIHDIRKSIDYMDALSAGYNRRWPEAKWGIRAFVREEARRLMAYESLIFDYFDHHTIISAQDRDLIAHPQRKEIQVVTNGVDTTFYHLSQTQSNPYQIVFTGNMSYPPNVSAAIWLVNEIWPLVKLEIPEANVLIAGANPATEVKDLQQKGVHVSGWLEDIREAYHQSQVFVAPMKSGSGMQNKLLEAMSCGLPCVTTSLAATALGSGHEEVLLQGEDAHAIAKQIVLLMKDETLRAQLGAQARAYVQSHFSWKASTDAMLDKWISLRK